MSAAVNTDFLRVVDADPATILAKLADSSLIETGRVQIVDLERVRARLAAGWPERRARVHARIEAQAARLLSPADLFVQLGDTEYLLVTSSVDGARATALGLLRDLLFFLFGHADPADLVVKTVMALGPEGVTARRLSDSEVTQGLAAAESQAGAASDAAPGPSGAVRTPILSAMARELEVEHRPAPLIDLAQGRVVGASVWRRVLDSRSGAELAVEDVHRLPPATLEAIDLAAAGLAAALASRTDRAAPALIVAPLSLTTLGVPRGRLALLNLLQALPTPVDAKLVVEITGLTQGFLTTRVREAVSAMRPYCRGVFAQIPTVRSAAEQLRDCGLRGASFLAGDLAQAARLDPNPRKLTEAAALVGPGLMICGLRTVRAVAIARLIGASLAVLDPDHAQEVLAGSAPAGPSV